MGNVQPAWSPDGSKIAFARTGASNLYEIFTMNSDGTNQLQLTHDGVIDAEPSWSPDGTKILFTSNQDDSNPSRFDIHVMNSDGTSGTRLTSGPGSDAG